MKLRSLMAAAVAAGGGLLAAGSASAQTDWTVEAGGAMRLRPAHIGSSHYLWDVAPVFEASLGEDVTVSVDDGLKWRALKLGPVRLGPIAEYRQSFNDQLPPGALPMSDAIEIGGFGEWRTPLGIAEARLRRAVNGYQGWSGDLSFSTGGAVSPKLDVGGQARVSWADSRFADTFFGLRPSAASRFGLPRFQDEDFVTVGGEFDVARQLTARSRVVLALSADRMVGELRTSPLFQTRNIFTASLGLTYRIRANSTGRTP
jgi:outer membrane scaffolding protein for murein synthesis (MipA/OmpV family)